MAVVALVALVALVAVAALPPIDRALAVPVRPVPGPLKYVFAVTIVPVTAAAVVPPIAVPSIAPPVIATEPAFCVDIVPRPDTWVLEIAIAVLVTLVTWPWALVTNTGTWDAEP